MKELIVSFNAFGSDIKIGTLADNGNDVLFQYSPEVIAQGLELSPIRLPLRPQAYPDQQTQYINLQRVPGLLYDSLPDGWGFKLMNRRMRAKGIDPDSLSTLDRLSYLGANTMGALTYAPSNESIIDTKALTLIELASEVQEFLLDDGREVLNELARAGGSPGGARPKALVYFDPQSGQMSTQSGFVSDDEPWLVKFPSDDDASDSCALEELYARMAKACSLGMMETQHFELAGGKTAFATKRYDRQNAQRVHVHSLAGVLQSNFQIASLSYADYFKVTRRLTKDQRELKKAVQRCVFNVLMNNKDDHAKNFAFMMTKEREWKLAPPFDLTYCPGYRGEHFLDIAGEGKSPTRNHIIKAADSAGLSAKDTNQIIDELLATTSDETFKRLAKELPIKAKTVTEVAKIIDGNRKRLMSD